MTLRRQDDQRVPVIAALAKEGITLELVKFSGHTQSNQALADTELDLNAFQRIAFLAHSGSLC
ncbi:MetQ/NlpA family ABC transporter substrate-binding protein [Parasphaerochaeta coccoides]|uniref:MetQ/NlpA family ABC transporter substrate-binding protein n=1 Tax=Parasphaerochaeta coccoides TaxID=273376 RepID=UPI001C06DD09